MGIKFSNNNLKTTEFNTYSIDKFNGCDYTTVPTNVDETRAIEISNYIPYGDALKKRNGWTLVNHCEYNGKQLVVQDVWKIKDYFVIYAFESDNGSNPRIYYCKSLNEDAIDTSGNSIGKLTSLYNTNTTITSASIYSYGVVFEDRLFVLAMNRYLMVWIEDGVIKCDLVSNHAYIPETIVGIGDIDSSQKSMVNQEFNFLVNKAYMTILNYSPSASSTTTKKFDIGQYLGQNVKNITIEEYYDEYEGQVISDTSVFSFSNGILTHTKQQGTEYTDARYIRILVSWEQDGVDITNQNIVNGMRFGCPYGSSSYRDRLFLSGNPFKKNMDIHSCEAGEGINAWKDYTYFGTDSYQMFGSSEYAVTGYGLLSNGNMAIFKETQANMPNLYIRTYDIVEDTSKESSLLGESVYVERYAVYPFGVNINCDEIGNVITYGSDLLVNNKHGIYKVLVETSTATQTYDSVEMSYFIRDNLGDTLEDCCSVVYDGKLYVCRYDLNGKQNGNKRVYVADTNRYSILNNHYIYEWWCLDGINASKLFVVDNELYFVDKELGLCVMDTTYFDTYNLKCKDVNVHNSTISSECFLAINDDNNTLVLDTSSRVMRDILSSDEVDNAFGELKKYSKITFGKDLLFKLNIKGIYENNQVKFTANTWHSLLSLLVGVYNDYKLFIKTDVENHKGKILKITQMNSVVSATSMLDDEMDDTTPYDYTITTQFEKEITLDAEYDEWELNAIGIIIPSGNEVSIHEIYTNSSNDKGCAYSKCELIDGTWFYKTLDEHNQEISTNVGNSSSLYFNVLELGIENNAIDFEFIDSNGTIDTINNVVFTYNMPIDSYWKGKYTSLNGIAYLKSTYSITFAPDVRLGGNTRVGYRTTKRDVSYLTNASNNSLDFNDIDFELFTFGEETVARTYTAKKKIKNFSYIQLKFYSSDDKNSTISALTIRYKTTRVNKGVK